jgi:hypothetical protein
MLRALVVRLDLILEEQALLRPIVIGHARKLLEAPQISEQVS